MSTDSTAHAEIASIRQELANLKRNMRELEGRLESLASQQSLWSISSSFAIPKSEQSPSNINDSEHINLGSVGQTKIEDPYDTPVPQKLSGNGSKDAPLEIMDSESEDNVLDARRRSPRKRSRSQETLMDELPSGALRTKRKRNIQRISSETPLADLKPQASHDDPSNIDHRPESGLHNPNADRADPEWMYDDLSEAEAKASLRSLFNPKAKVKEEMRFDEDTVLSRLKLVGLDPFPISLENNIRDVPVSRELISKLYGGNRYAGTPSIKKERVAVHGYDNFLCLNLEQNPHAPQLPGYPGLSFDHSPDVPYTDQDTTKTWILFVRLQGSQWQYVGNYRLSPAPPLSHPEWLLQAAIVRRKWAEEIQRKEWGWRVRAQVALRQRLGRDPTAADMEEATKTNDPFKSVTAQQILAAFNKGEQTMGISCMKCVSYHEALQRELAAEKNKQDS